MRIFGLGGQKRNGTREVTITVTAGAGSRPRQLCVSMAAVRLMVALFAVLLVAVVLLIVSYGIMSKRSLSAEALRDENERLHEQVARLTELEQRVDSMDRSRRTLLGVAGVAITDSSFMGAEAGPESTSPASAIYRHVHADSSVTEGEVGEIRELLSQLPLEGPMTRGFGPIGTGQFHTGIDIAGNTGSSVCAAGEGVVSFIGTDETFGLVLIVAHTSRLATMYGHNSQLHARVGDFVSAGQEIGEVGSTGRSSAPHLHLEVHWDGAAIDPAQVIPGIGSDM